MSTTLINLLPPEQRAALIALSGAAHVNKTVTPHRCDWCDEDGFTVTVRCHGDTLTMHPGCRDQHMARLTCAFHGDDWDEGE